MADDSLVPTPAPSDVPTFKILVEGNELNSAYKVLNISVAKEFNKITNAEINLLDGNVSKEDFEVSNTDDLIIGKNVEIQAGYHGQNSTIFKGIIVKHGIKILGNTGSTLNLVLKNIAYKSTLVRNNLVFNDKTDSDIIEAIIDNYGIDKDVESTDTNHESLMQFNCSDWDFINMRAEANAKLVFTGDDKIIVKKPDITTEKKLSLQYGSSILEFEAEMDGRTSFSNYKASAWDYSSQQLTEVEQTSDANEISQGNLTASDIASTLSQENFYININASLKDESEINSLADSYIQKNNLSRIKGRVKSIGFADINPGDIVELIGVGDRFNGKSLVSGVSHEINQGLWQTNIQFGLDEKIFAEKFDNIIERKASGLLPAINGLQIGKVIKLEGDPLSEDRIQIKLPVITDSDNTFWARVATLDAGKNRGSFFRPEIDDEVIVGFIDDNPNCAVVLGMLNSSALPAPITAQDANNIKGIYTREKMKMEFDDDKKSIDFETPGGNKLTISDDAKGISIIDQNGNKIVMDDNGITIESAKDFNVKASGDAKLEGTNVSTKASASFKAEGSAGAEVSSSASTTIKGSIVQIN